MKAIDVTPDQVRQSVMAYIGKQPFGMPMLDAALVALAERAGVRQRVTFVRFGGCIEAIGTEFQGAMRRSGHAHCSRSDVYRGAICIKSLNTAKAVKDNGEPTYLLAHEFAHVAVMQGHTAKWREVMTRLGYPDEAQQYARNAA